MGEKRGKYNWKCDIFLLVIVFIGSLVAIIAINIAIAHWQHPHPQAILALGGSPDREVLAAQLASQNPQLIVWVSSGEGDQTSSQIFHNAKISPDRYFLDHRATDTVTNFTTLVEDFKQHHIKHLYLITSDYHMPRAKAIATIILGSRGIAFTPISVVHPRQRDRQESTGKIFRDIARSILWIFSGYTGANIKDI